MKDCTDDVHFAYLAKPNLEILFEIKKFKIIYNIRKKAIQRRSGLHSWNHCKLAVGESVLAAGKVPEDVSEVGKLDPHRYTSVGRLLRQHVSEDCCKGLTLPTLLPSFCLDKIRT